ncbi:hypothetical protein LWX53_05580 [bacterium]|nr:hypothetical protein [bacterium]
MRRFFAPTVLAACVLASCSPEAGEILMPAGDIRPPAILEAGQRSPGTFEVLFDEDISPVGERFAFDPGGVTATPRSEGASLKIALEPRVGAGVPCSLCGEAKDAAGNVTRFLFTFVGYNERPAKLRLNEVQTGKNSSASNPRRDYVEFLAEEGGDLGGVFVQWASAAKLASYAFPPCEVSKGSVIVLHCAPEGVPSEVDEAGADLGASGGVDASASGRDFWTQAGGLPDETGVIVLRDREADPPRDGLFYAASTKTGAIDSAKLLAAFSELSGAGLWAASSPPAWEDGFAWKSSSSRPLHRSGGGKEGKEAWYVGESGTQSPGLAGAGLPKAKAAPKKSKRSAANGG